MSANNHFPPRTVDCTAAIGAHVSARGGHATCLKLSARRRQEKGLSRATCSTNTVTTNERYIPALGFGWMTRFYDPLVRFTTRERKFKKALIEQAGLGDGDRVLDLACGTGTLAILIKQTAPSAKVTAIDGDPAILGAARTKAGRAHIEIHFDEGMSFSLPYADGSFDRVLSSLFFHHLTTENKLKTLLEVKRVLQPGREFHVADWGLPANPAMKFASRFIQLLDGQETTADSFGGLLPGLLQEAGFDAVEETGSFNTLFGTLRLHKALKR